MGEVQQFIDYFGIMTPFFYESGGRGMKWRKKLGNNKLIVFSFLNRYVKICKTI